MNLLDILFFAQNINSQVREKAEKHLENFEKESPLDFYSDLFRIFKKESISFDIRGLAGLILKNQIDFFIREGDFKKNEKSLKIKGNFFKIQLKKMLFETFDSPSIIVRRTSSQIFAKVSKMEILEGKGRQIFQSFFSMFSNGKSGIFYSSILETIEFICQEFQFSFFPKILEEFSKELFDIIVFSTEQPFHREKELEISSLKAFNASIFLMKRVFKEKLSQEITFKLILEQLNNKTKGVQIVVFEILDKIAQEYYPLLENYISIIFHFTLSFLNEKHDNELVTLQIIEFWLTIADTEFELTTNSIRAVYEGRNPSNYSRHFILQSSQFFVSFLLEMVEKGDIECGNEEWNCCVAAGTCLNLMSQVAPGEIVPQSLYYIENKLNPSVPLKSKECAALVFVAILDGLGSKMMYQHVLKTISFWLHFLEAESFNLRSMIFWIIGKICFITPYLLRNILGRVIQAMVRNFNNHNTIYKTCWSLNGIFQSFGIEGAIDWCFEWIFFTLMNLILYQKPENLVRDEIFEIFCSMILNSSTRNKLLIASVSPILILKLKESLTLKNSNKAEKIQSQMFRVIGCSIQKLGSNLSLPCIEKMLDLISTVCTLEKETSFTSTLEEEFLVCIGTIIQIAPKKIENHLSHLVPFLLKNIKNDDNFQTSSLAIGLLGDICRGTRKKFKPFIQKSASVFFFSLQSLQINPNLKPLILVGLGDLALTDKFLGKNFPRNVLDSFKETVKNLEAFSNSKDFEQKEWSLSMEESVIEGLIGIIQSFQDENDKLQNEKLFQTVFWVPNFLRQTLANDRKLRTVEACIGLVGDLSLNFFFFRKESINCCWIRQILFEAKKSKESKKKILGSWIYELIFC